jgi:hypothetical protein
MRSVTGVSGGGGASAVEWSELVAEWINSSSAVESQLSSARELQGDRRQPARTWSRERGSWIYGFENRYQAKTGEDIAD